MITLREIFLARRTVLEMCGDRGYDINDFISELSEDNFYNTYIPNQPIEIAHSYEYKENISFFNITLKNKYTQDIIYISFNDEERLGLKTIRTIIDSCRNNNIIRIIIISHGISPSAQKEIDIENTKGGIIEFHKYERMFFNVTKHKLVPKHTVLTEEQKIELLKEKKLKEQDLPKIKHIDPVIRYYGVSKGTVIQIERISESAGKSLYYRIVE